MSEGLVVVSQPAALPRNGPPRAATAWVSRRDQIELVEVNSRFMDIVDRFASGVEFPMLVDAASREVLFKGPLVAGRSYELEEKPKPKVVHYIFASSDGSTEEFYLDGDATLDDAVLVLKMKVKDVREVICAAWGEDRPAKRRRSVVHGLIL
jgi:hypothetical protein